MKLLSSSHLSDYSITSRKEWIPSITFSTDYETELLDAFSQLVDADITALQLLQSFNDRIIDVNTIGWQYTIKINKGIKKLAFQRLSRGERLFLLCRVAERTCNPIFVCHELSQLSGSNLVRFFSDFRKSRFITVVSPTEMLYPIMEELL